MEKQEDPRDKSHSHKNNHTAHNEILQPFLTEWGNNSLLCWQTYCALWCLSPELSPLHTHIATPLYHMEVWEQREKVRHEEREARVRNEPMTSSDQRPEQEFSNHLSFSIPFFFHIQMFWMHVLNKLSLTCLCCTFVSMFIWCFFFPTVTWQLNLQYWHFLEGPVSNTPTWRHTWHFLPTWLRWVCFACLLFFFPLNANSPNKRLCKTEHVQFSKLDSYDSSHAKRDGLNSGTVNLAVTV